MVVAFLIWCPHDHAAPRPRAIPPRPTASNLHFSEDALGWFKGTFWPQISAVAMIVAFGHALLSMSGFETLAQVYREIAYPKLKNLKITANIVCCVRGVLHRCDHAIRGDDHPGRGRATSTVHNLLGGLAMNLAGPYLLRLRSTSSWSSSAF